MLSWEYISIGILRRALIDNNFGVIIEWGETGVLQINADIINSSVDGISRESFLYVYSSGNNLVYSQFCVGGFC